MFRFFHLWILILVGIGLGGCASTQKTDLSTSRGAIQTIQPQEIYPYWLYEPLLTTPLVNSSSSTHLEASKKIVWDEYNRFLAFHDSKTADTHDMESIDDWFIDETDNARYSVTQYDYDWYWPERYYSHYYGYPYDPYVYYGWWDYGWSGYHYTHLYYPRSYSFGGSLVFAYTWWDWPYYWGWPYYYHIHYYPPSYFDRGDDTEGQRRSRPHISNRRPGMNIFSRPSADEVNSFPAYSSRGLETKKRRSPTTYSMRRSIYRSKLNDSNSLLRNNLPQSYNPSLRIERKFENLYGTPNLSERTLSRQRNARSFFRNSNLDVGISGRSSNRSFSVPRKTESAPRRSVSPNSSFRSSPSLSPSRSSKSPMQSRTTPRYSTSR